MRFDFEDTIDWLKTVFPVAVLIAIGVALFVLLHVRVDENGRWWVRSTYGGIRIPFTTFLWSVAAIAILFWLIRLAAPLFSSLSLW